MNTRRARRIACLWGLALFGLPVLIVEASAESADSDWQLSVPLYLQGGAYFRQKGDASVTFEALAANLELLLSSPIRPYSVGLFFNSRISPDSRYNGTLNLGGFLEYRADRWDTSTYLFRNQSRGAPGLWVFGEQFRYQVADRHKLGIEVIGTFKDPGASTLMLGYYGTISRTISVKFVAGAKINAGGDRVARTELVWRIH
jgi:hypothetical protein